jgi:hypothetical protein
MMKTRAGTSRGLGRRVALALGLAASGLAVAGGPAHADPGTVLDQALMSARAGTPCGQFGPDQQVAHAADIINRSTRDYLAQHADTVPADAQHPDAIVKDLGIPASKTFALLGAAQSPGDAIKGLLVQGFAAIPDCSYNRMGTSMIYDADSGYTLVTAVLVGP